MKYILISDAVRLTGLDRQTIRNWIEKGIIPAKKINGTFYVDEDTFRELISDIQDVERARAGLASVRDEYFREKDEYNRLRRDFLDEKDVNRFLSVCVNGGIRTQFFKNTVGIMQALGILSEKEGAILTAVLNGESLDDIAGRIGHGRDYIRHIAKKAVRKSGDLSTLIDMVSRKESYENRISELESEIAALRRLVAKQSLAGLGGAEGRLLNMGWREVTDILTKPLSGMNLSTRTVNILAKLGISTIGELCRLSRNDIMQQRNAGKGTADELETLLASCGLTWGMGAGV